MIGEYGSYLVLMEFIYFKFIIKVESIIVYEIQKIVNIVVIIFGYLIDCVYFLNNCIELDIVIFEMVICEVIININIRIQMNLFERFDIWLLCYNIFF